MSDIREIAGFWADRGCEYETALVSDYFGNFRVSSVKTPSGDTHKVTCRVRPDCDDTPELLSMQNDMLRDWADA
jgi:hypothetical protein